MKTTVKLLLVVCLFGSTVFADGNQGSTGQQCNPQVQQCGIAAPPAGEEPTEITTVDDNVYLAVIKTVFTELLRLDF